MKAKVHINGDMLEGIDMKNGLRLESTIALLLFNLYAYLVFG